MVCDRSGTHFDSHAYMNVNNGGGGRKRKDPAKQPSLVLSRKTDYQFRLYCRPDDSGTWRWVQVFSKLEQNHELSGGAGRHAIHRTMTPEQITAATTAIHCGVAPAKVWDTMATDYKRQGKAFKPTKKDMFNLYTKLKEQNRCGITDAQSLVEHLDRHYIPYRIQVDQKNRLHSLFLTEPMSIALAQKYAYVIQVDLTFNTNKYDLPLLCFVSSTPTNTTFTLAIAFLGGKTEKHVLWAMRKFKVLMGALSTVAVVTDEEDAIRNAITIVFGDWRQILCRWHMQNTIKKACNNAKVSKEEESKISQQFWAMMALFNIHHFHIDKAVQKLPVTFTNIVNKMEPTGCTNMFFNNLGLPCAHRLLLFILTETAVPFDTATVHAFWSVHSKSTMDALAKQVGIYTTILPEDFDKDTVCDYARYAQPPSPPLSPQPNFNRALLAANDERERLEEEDRRLGTPTNGLRNLPASIAEFATSQRVQMQIAMLINRLQEYMPAMMKPDLQSAYDTLKKTRRTKPTDKTRLRDFGFCAQHEGAMLDVVGLHARYPAILNLDDLASRAITLKGALLERFQPPGLSEVVKEVTRELKRFVAEKRNWHDMKSLGSEERCTRGTCGYYGAAGRLGFGRVLKVMVSVDPFPDILRSRDMPELFEDDLIEQVLMAEMIVLLLMQDIARPDREMVEARDLAEQIRLESGAYGECNFPCSQNELLDSEWSPELNTVRRHIDVKRPSSVVAESISCEGEKTEKCCTFDTHGMNIDYN